MRKLICFMLIFSFVLNLFIGSTHPTYGAENMKVIQVGAGDYYTAILRSDGTLWDFNEQEWDGFGARKFLDQVQEISVGNSHGMAIKEDSSLWGWGSNITWQIGDGSDINHISTPVKVLEQVVMISAGSDFTLAVKTDHSLWGWGDDEEGQLGPSEERAVKTPIKIMNNVRSAAAGYECSYILKEDHSLWALGASPYVPESQSITTEPVQIATDIEEIFVDTETDKLLYLKKDDSLWSWSIKKEYDESLVGRISSAVTRREAYITAITPNKIADDVMTADYNSGKIGFVKKDGTLWLQNDDYDYLNTTMVMGDVASFSLGYKHGVAVKKDGTLWGWGENDYGQLGSENPNFHNIPQQLSLGDNISQIFMDDHYFSYLNKNHTLVVYKYSNISKKYTFTKTMNNVKKLVYGQNYAAVLTEDQTLYLIQGNFYGELSWDRSMKLMDQVVSVDAKYTGLCAVTADDSLWFYDLSAYDKMDVEEVELTPEKVTGNVKEIAMNMDYYEMFPGVFVLKKDGVLSYFFLDASEWVKGASEPQKITSDVISIANVANVGALIKADGSLWTWGYNTYGEVGNGTTDATHEPTKILDDVATVYLAEDHAMAIKKDGSLWAWGRNNMGQLGTGSNEEQWSPIKIMVGAKSVALGENLSFVLKTDGTIWAFGYDDSGFFLGENINNYFNKPIEIKIPQN